MGRVEGTSLVMGRAVLGRFEAARRAAPVVGLEVNMAAAVAVPRASGAAARARVEVPWVTTMVVLVAAARVGVGLAVKASPRHPWYFLRSSPPAN